jgi:hypothetical protein
MFLAGRGLTKECIANPTTAEALAAVYVVIFRKKRGYRQIIFKGNAMQIVQAIKDNNTLQRCYGHFVEGIQAELQTLGKGVFNYVAREANGDAHVLSKLATTHVIDTT